MARTRGSYLAALCKGWRVEQVQQIVAETLTELITRMSTPRPATLIAEHRAAAATVVLSAPRRGNGPPIGELLGIPTSSPPGWA